MKEKKVEVKFIVINPLLLKSDGLNPNKMTKGEMEALKKSIRRYGFITPVVVNKENIIVDGEQRWQASKELKLKEIPVVAINVEEVDRRILRQVMNKLKGKHDPLLDLSEFKKIYNDEGLKMLEELTFIEEDNLSGLIGSFDENMLLDDLDKNSLYGKDIVTNDAVAINVNKIKPTKWNPSNLGNASYSLLKRSIKSVGMLNPIVVREKGNFFELVDGESRWKIAKELGAQTIQAKIIKVKSEIEAKAISFSLNKLKGKLDSNKSTALVNEIRKAMEDDKNLQEILGLDKKKLDRYLAFGADGVFFETPTGIVVRQYLEGEYNEQNPSLILIFKTVEDLAKVKTKLLGIDKDLTVALLELCKEEEKN
jgi:ParB-like chromosome segregation protein Spo0J